MGVLKIYCTICIVYIWEWLFDRQGDAATEQQAWEREETAAETLKSSHVSSLIFQRQYKVCNLFKLNQMCFCGIQAVSDSV